jgi:hypothetical protein
MAEAIKDVAAERDALAADRDRLQQENERLRAQLDAAGRPGQPGAPVQHVFQLSQGDLTELERNGWANIDGRVMTIADVRARLAGTPQSGLKITEPKNPQVPKPADPTNIRGFDYVYPSVSRGEIDPAIAGTPGINGPAAGEK